MKTKEARQLNAVISQMTFGSVPDKLITIIEALAELGIICKKADELELAAIKGLGLEIVGSQVKADSPELHSQLVKALDELGDKEVNIELPKLTKNEFAMLAKENSSIKGGSILLISQHMLE